MLRTQNHDSTKHSSRGSILIRVTRLWDGRRWNRGSVPGVLKRFFPPPVGPDLLLGTSTILDKH